MKELEHFWPRQTFACVGNWLTLASKLQPSLIRVEKFVEKSCIVSWLHSGTARTKRRRKLQTFIISMMENQTIGEPLAGHLILHPAHHPPRTNIWAVFGSSSVGVELFTHFVSSYVGFGCETSSSGFEMRCNFSFTVSRRKLLRVVWILHEFQSRVAAINLDWK